MRGTISGTNNRILMKLSNPSFELASTKINNQKQYINDSGIPLY